MIGGNADGTVSGDASLDYLDEATDPVTGKPGCSVPATFTARPPAG